MTLAPVNQGIIILMLHVYRLILTHEYIAVIKLCAQDHMIGLGNA